MSPCTPGRERISGELGTPGAQSMFAPNFLVTSGEPFSCTHSVKFKKWFQTDLHRAISYHAYDLQHHIQYYGLLSLPEHLLETPPSDLYATGVGTGSSMPHAMERHDMMCPFGAKGEAILSVLQKCGLPSIALQTAPSWGNIRWCPCFPARNWLTPPVCCLWRAAPSRAYGNLLKWIHPVLQAPFGDILIFTKVLPCWCSLCQCRD